MAAVEVAIAIANRRTRSGGAVVCIHSVGVVVVDSGGKAAAVVVVGVIIIIIIITVIIVVVVVGVVVGVVVAAVAVAVACIACLWFPLLLLASIAIFIRWSVFLLGAL